MFAFQGAVPNEVAAGLIRNLKPSVRKQWDRLSPALRARSLVVTGVEDMNVLQDIRDALAKVPQGADWAATEAQVLELLQRNPYFADNPEAAERRAELLMRHHAFMAYQAAAWYGMKSVAEDLPYWKYQTVGDERVREAHAALDGIILRHDDPFWADHYPPWDFGCRCQVVAISAEEYAEVAAKDAQPQSDPEFEQQYGFKRQTARVLGEAQLKRLHEYGQLDDGTGRPVDVRSPRVRRDQNDDKASEFAWNPGNLRMDVDDLRKRYDDEAFAHFEAQMRAVQMLDGLPTEITEDQRKRYGGMSLWDWLNEPTTAEELKRRTNYAAAAAAEVLNALPDSNAIKKLWERWANDKITQRNIAWGKSDNQRQQREELSDLIKRIKPYESEEPLVRGVKSRYVDGRDLLQEILDQKMFTTESPAMSASKDPEVAERQKFLEADGFIMEIRKHKSARDIVPIIEVFPKTGKTDEAEVVFPMDTKFKLKDNREVDIIRDGKKFSVPYIVVEEV